MSFIDDLIPRLDARIQEIQGEIATLQAARSVLVDGSTVGKDPRPSGRARGRHKTAPAPKFVVAPAGKLVAILSEHEGLSTPSLAKLANANPVQVLALLRELEEQGQVKRTGQRRGTKWHIITDEDRIAARAAELQAHSRSSSP